jgi:hypothetical protein
MMMMTGPPDLRRPYIHDCVNWEGVKGKNLNQYVKSHTANTHNPEPHFPSYPHLFDTWFEAMFVAMFRNCVSTFQIYNRTSYCFTFYFSSETIILSHS